MPHAVNELLLSMNTAPFWIVTQWASTLILTRTITRHKDLYRHIQERMVLLDVEIDQCRYLLGKCGILLYIMSSIKNEKEI